MAKYQYFARDTSGRAIRGVLEASSQSELVSILKGKRLTVVSARKSKEKVQTERKTTGRVKLPEIAFFFRQLATMVSAGVSITDSLRELAAQIKNVTLSGIIQEVRSDIEKGSTFSQSLAKYPKFFPVLITAMIKSGEEGGTLSDVLEQISTYLEDKIALQREVRSATIYPIFIAGFFLFALAFVTFFLIPKFREMFTRFDVALPLLTRIVMSISYFLLKNLFFFIIALFLLVFACYRYSKTYRGQRVFNRLKFRLPLVGETFRMVSLSYFAQTFSALINSGVPVIKCLRIVGVVSGSPLIEDASEKIRAGVESGATISEEMKKHPIFPPLMSRMVVVGEQTGRLGEMFYRVNRFYRDEAMTRTRMLTSTLEPVMLLGLGFVVGVVVIALYLPIFKLTGSIKM